MGFTKLRQDVEAESFAIQADAVSVTLGRRRALAAVTCSIRRGAFVGLIGPNGSGKSTLIRAILGILPLDSGRILVNGRGAGESRGEVAYLPQRQDLQLDLPLRALDVVLMGRLRARTWLKGPSKEDRSLAADAMDKVGLTRMANVPVGEMSFGQQQRVLFARALCQRGGILLVDEPMTGVDPQTQDLMLEILKAEQGNGTTIVMATHDLNQVQRTCDTICILNQKLFAFGSVEDTLNESVLQEAYGAHLHLVHGGEHIDHVLEDVHHHEARD